MRRKPGTLVGTEVQALGALVDALVGGEPELHGFALARTIADRDGSRKLTSHGTLYKALGRMEDAGLVTSRWEDPALAEAAGRPRRRLYRVTSAGQVAFASESERAAGAPADRWAGA